MKAAVAKRWLHDSSSVEGKPETETVGTDKPASNKPLPRDSIF